MLLVVIYNFTKMNGHTNVKYYFYVTTRTHVHTPPRNIVQLKPLL